MVNPEHIDKLREGVKSWNKWREKNPSLKVDISEINLRDLDGRGINLSLANLSGTNLTRANLVFANLSGANLARANFIFANLRNTNLSNANLSEANLSKANLSTANLSEANLSKANLINSYFDETNLEGANLSNANLMEVQALAANFERAILTGACIEDWNISSRTNLDNVICDYIYLKQGQQERRPSDPNRNFEPGEFTKLFQKALETVDLIFSDGIDWQAFLTSFQKLQSEDSNWELAIQAIEKKSGGAFVVRVEAPLNTNKAEVERYLKREYQIQLKAIEERYRLQLNAKEEQIEIYKQNSANIMKMAELVAKVSNPTIVNLEAKVVAESETKIDQSNSSMGIGVNQGEVKTEKLAGTINEAQPQNLAQAAADIQQLLNQLQQNQNISLEDAQHQIAKDLVAQAKSDSTFRTKLIKWGQSLGDAIVKTSVSEAVKGVIKLTLTLL